MKIYIEVISVNGQTEKGLVLSPCNDSNKNAGVIKMAASYSRYLQMTALRFSGRRGRFRDELPRRARFALINPPPFSRRCLEISCHWNGVGGLIASLPDLLGFGRPCPT